MAIKPCKECGGPVSDEVKNCPQCGRGRPNKNSIISWLLVIILISGGGWWLVDTLSSGAISGKTNPYVQKPISGEVATNWVYHTTKDEMRGTEVKFATIVSANSVNFDFPYDGGSKLILTLRKNGNKTDVMIKVSKGQILCAVRGCEASFKFDSGNIQQIKMSKPDDYASDVLFIVSDETKSKIINLLKVSNKLIIEVPFYREGKKQFTFDVNNLE